MDPLTLIIVGVVAYVLLRSTAASDAALGAQQTANTSVLGKLIKSLQGKSSGSGSSGGGKSSGSSGSGRSSGGDNDDDDDDDGDDDTGDDGGSTEDDWTEDGAGGGGGGGYEEDQGEDWGEGDDAERTLTGENATCND